MRLGCLLIIMAIGFIAVGCQGLYVALTNRTPTVMTYQEFLQKKPSSGWIEVSDARLNLLSAIHESNRFTGTIKQVYIPVSASAAGEEEEEGDDQIHLLLLTKDEAILQTLKDFEAVAGEGGGLVGRLKRRIEEKKNPAAGEPAAKDAALEQALRFMLQNRDRVRIDRPIRGMIQFGLDSDSRDRRKIKALDSKIAPDFAVLEDGAQPQVGFSVFALLSGLGLAGLLLARARRAGGATPPPTGSPGESAPATDPKIPSDS
jgi:hypothetical protein